MFKDPSLIVGAKCSRRAGKTHGAAVKSIAVGHQWFNAQIPYLALTAESAYNIMWNVLLQNLNRLEVPHIATESDLSIKLTETGTVINLFGADQKGVIERLAGSKYPLATVDEGQGFKQKILQRLVEKILIPAVSDYDGQVWVMGTPPDHNEGYFYENTLPNSTWSTYFWTMFDNPHMGDPHAFLQKTLKATGRAIDDPLIQREFFGISKEDTEKLVYVTTEANWKILNKDHFEYKVLAADFGMNDKSALSVVGYNLDDPVIGVLETFGQSKLGLTAFAELIQRYIEVYKPCKIVGDHGGLGAMIIDDIKFRYGIPIHNATKKDKLAGIAVMNDKFRTKTLIADAVKCKTLKLEYNSLVWENGAEHPNRPNDESDTTLYAFRETPYIAIEKAKKLTEEEKMEEAEEAAFRDMQFHKRRFGGIR